MASLKERYKKRKEVQFMKKKISSQQNTIVNLQDNYNKLQALTREDNFLQLLDTVTSYKGNEYNTYGTAILEIDNKYNGTARWGVAQTGTIIDSRAAFIMGEGLKVSAKDEEGKKELEWVEAFLEYNDIDQEIAQEFAKEAEIEGKIALKLAIENDKDADPSLAEEEIEKKISVRFISWLEKKYKVTPNPLDYLDYQKLTWVAQSGDDKLETLDAKEFVYKKFGGRISKPNEAAPKIMKCLTQIDALDHAERDWREINHIFAGPILYAMCKDNEEVKNANTAFNDKNFKIKKLLVGTADVKFIGFDIKGVDSLEREISACLKIISGATGIPVHFLGFVDLMKNRSTADSLLEMINAATIKERKIWIGVYEEVIRKAMTMWNDTEQQGMGKKVKLDPSKIKVEIPIITQEHYDRIEKVYLPACLGGKLSDEALIEMLPGVDPKVELERKEEKEKSELAQIKKDNEERDARDLEANLNRGTEEE